MSSEPRLGWIGLGNMGRGMAKNLVAKGNLKQPLVVQNRTRSRAADFASANAHSEACDTIGEVVSKSDIIFYCLGDDAAVNATVDELLKTDLSSKLIVDCSTVHPDTTAAVSDRLTSKGEATFLAAPVFGAPAMADAGQLVIVLSGPTSAIARVKPFCTGVMGRATIEFDDAPPSKATQLKLIGNTFILSMVTALAEGHTVAEKTGLGSDKLHQFIEALFPGPYTAYSNRMMSGDYYKREEPLFAVDLARKDARHAKKIGSDVGVDMKGVGVADGYLVGVKENMGEKGDIAGIYGAVRVEAGLKFENGQ